jgi:hypothetical protein
MVPGESLSRSQRNLQRKKKRQQVAKQIPEPEIVPNEPSVPPCYSGSDLLGLPGVSRARVDEVLQPLVPLVQLPDGLGVSSRNPVSNCSSESESECCSSASSGAPVGNALTMEDFRARNRLHIVHEAASLLTNRQRKIPIEIDNLCAFVCSFFGLSAGEVTDAINEWEQLGIMCIESNATVFFQGQPTLR